MRYINPIRVTAVFYLLLSSFALSAAYNTLQTSVVFGSNGTQTSFAGGHNADGIANLQNAFLGKFFANSEISINGANMRVQANGGGATCTGIFHFRCYRQGSAPTAFTAMPLASQSTIVPGVFLWNSNASVDLMSNFSTPGVYVLECYWTSTGNPNNASCNTSYIDNNAGNYHKATLEYCLTDAFTDTNFSSGPTWSGDTNDFLIVNSSDVSASDATASQTLRLNAPNSNGTRYLSKPEANWSNSQTWSFWIGRRSQAYNNANNVAVWLYANESNLESNTVDGYRLFVGDNSGADEIRLQSITNNAPTNLITSSTGVANNRTDVGFNVIVRRSSAGVWTIHTSTMPTSNGSGVNAHSNAFTTATVFQGTATNLNYVPNGTGYMGVVVNHTNSTNAARAFEMDNFYFTGGPTLQCPTGSNTIVDAGCGMSIPVLLSGAVIISDSFMAHPIVLTQSPLPGTTITGTGITQITITATDARSNASTCQVAINRIDQVAPIVNCASNISTTSSPGSCGALVNYSVSATDNCMNCAPNAIPGYTLIGNLNGHAYFRSNAAFTWSAANAAAQSLGGHLATLTNAAESGFLGGIGAHWIGLTDEANEGQWLWVTGEPFIYSQWSPGEPNNSGNQDYGVVNFSGNNWDDDGAWASRPYVLEIDCVTLTQTQGLPSGSLFPIGITTNSFTATDASGNTTSCSFDITVLDTTLPTITCPANLTLNAPAGACTAIVNYITPTAFDNCGNCTSAPSINGFTTLGTYSGKAYYLSNNSVNYLAAQTAASASGGHLLTIGSAEENSFVANAVLSLGNNIWYWLGLDDAASEGAFAWNTGEALSYTNWSPNEPNNSGNNEDYAHVWNNGYWNDINGNNTMRFVIERSCVVPQLTQGLASGSAFPMGITTISYSATDASGNTATCSFNVQVNDITPPIIACPNNQNVVLANNCTTLMPDFRNLASVTDNCSASGSILVSQSPSPNSVLLGAGSIPVILTAVDASGNSASCTFNLTKQDNVAPVISVPSNVTINASTTTCGAVVNFAAPTVVDNCISCNVGAAISGFTYLGASGSIGYYISNVTSSYGTAQANCLAAGGYLAAINSVSENTFIRNAATALGFGPYGIGLSDQNNEGTWIWSNGELLTYTNWSGGEPNNSGNEDFVQVYTNGFWNDLSSNQLYILEKPCLNLTQTAGLPSGSSFPIGTTTNAYSATDAAGNVASASFTITVLDNSLPVLSCPSNITVTAPSGSCAAIVNYSTVTATDNCGNCTNANAISGFTLLGSFNGSAYYISNTTAASGTVASSNCINQGGYLATITSAAENTFIRNAASAIGNASYLIGFSDATVEGVFQWTNGQSTSYTNWNAGEPNNSGNEDFTQVLANGNWNDINGANQFYVLEKTCIPVSRIAGLTSGSSFPVGTTVVTHAATDASGNTANCSFNVTVNETTPPTIVCPNTQTLNLQASCTTTLPDYSSLATVNDNCTNSNQIQWSQSPASGSLVGGMGNAPIQLTATDLSGNSASCSFTIQKVDAVAPSITCPANQTLYLNNDCQAQLPSYANQVILSDNCYSPAQLSVNQMPAVGTVLSGVGSQLVTMTVTDGNGNASNCSFNVSLIDSIAPQIICPQDQTIVLDNSNTAIMPDLTAISSATDNCSSSLVWAQSPISGSVLNGTTSVVATLEVSDASNVSSTCLVNVTTVAVATEISFTQTETTCFENSGTIQIPLTITNPSAAQQTIVVVMATGNLSIINNQASFNIVFPAGSSGNQILDVPIANNTSCSIDESIAFTIQSITGGNSAVVGAISTQVLHVLDDEHLRPTRLNDTFETTMASHWNVSNSTDWAVVSTSPISGSGSVQHQITNASGESWFSYNADNRSLLGVETTWEFQLDNMGQEPTPTNYFVYYLTSDQRDFTQGINGYAVGVRPSTTSSPDYITLWRVQTGGTFIPLVTSSIDLGSSHQTLGIRVVRDEQGLWTLFVDQDGGFDGLLSMGSQTDITNYEISYSGLYYRYTSASASLIKLDDLLIKQKACGQTYYSQSSGNAEDAIWALQPVATPISALPSAYNNFIVQSNHLVSLDNHFAAKDLTIQASATLNAAEKKVYVFGDFSIDGNYLASDGFLIFKGETDQQIMSNSDIQFNHVVIDNDDHMVHLPFDVLTNIQQNKVICVTEGTLNTHDNLVLKSSSAGTASIGEITNEGFVSGRVTMERYIPSLNNYPYGSWVAVGCSVEGISMHDWNDDFITTGFVGSDYPPPYSFTNIQYYNEAAPGEAGNGFVGVNNINDSLKHKQGYFVYMQTPTQFVDVTGVIQQHNFNQPLSFTNTGHADDGWNLMVNQYPSEIDFRQMALNSTGVASYYLYDAEAANYKVYNGWANVGTAPQRVAMNQSFFVQAAGPGAFLSYDEKFKTNQGAAWERTLPESGFASFQMSGPTGQDACVLYLNSTTSNAYEYTMDARKLMSANPNAVELALVSSDDHLLTIDARNPLAIDTEIAMYCEMPQVGTYTFLIDQVEDMPFGTCYVIEDLISGQTMAIHEGATWTISVTEPFSGYRFLIHTQNQAVIVVTDASCPNQNNGSISITGVNQDWIVIENMSNQTTVSATNAHTYAQLPAGEYLITIDPALVGCIPQVVGIQITEPIVENASVLAYEVATCNLENNGAATIYWSEMAPFHYELIDNNNTIIHTGISDSEMLEWNNLAPGNYTIRLWTDCGEQILYVDTTDPDAVMVGILSDDTTIEIENGLAQQTTIYQNNINALETDWILNDVWSQSNSVFEHPFYLPGTYELILLAHNERCSATDTIQIEVEVVSPVHEQSEGRITISQSNNQIAILAQSLTQAIEQIDVFDMNGQLVYSEKINLLSGMYNIQKGDWSTGVYSIVLYDHTSPKIHKLFISQQK